MRLQDGKIAHSVLAVKRYCVQLPGVHSDIALPLQQGLTLRHQDIHRVTRVIRMELLEEELEVRFEGVNVPTPPCAHHES